MHITTMMKVLNGQKAKDYKILYSELSLVWRTTNTISFNIKSLIGNTIEIDWGDASVENSTIQTTGNLQTISQSFDSSIERTIKLKGSGVYTLSQLIINSQNFSTILLDEDNTLELPSLTTLNFKNSYNFNWPSNINWQLIPNLKTLILDSCYNEMSSLPFEDENDRPEKLENLSLYNTSLLTSLHITNYNSLKTLSIGYLGEENSSVRGEIVVSGCQNLVSTYVYACLYTSGYYFNDNPSLQVLNMNTNGSSDAKHGQILDISNSSSLTGLSLKYFGSMFAYDTSKEIELRKANNTSYIYQSINNCSFNKGMIPDYNTTPNLQQLIWYDNFRVSGEINISPFTALSSVEINQCYDAYSLNHPGLSAFTCLNNKAIKTCLVKKCLDLYKANIQNCTNLYTLDFRCSNWDNSLNRPDGNLEDLIIKNNSSLHTVYLNYNTLKYNFEISQCDNLYDFYACYTCAKKFTFADFDNLYKIDLDGNTSYNIPLREISITNCGKDRSMYIWCSYLNNLTKINIDTYYDLSDLRFGHNASLTQIKMINGTETTIPDYSTFFDGNASLTSINLANNNLTVSNMNNICNSLVNNAENTGTINFSGNANNYKPADSYIASVQNKGWTIITD